jgi:hypothetical protein
MSDQKFKSKVRLQGGAVLPQLSTEKALIIDANGEIADSLTSVAELETLSGVTGPVQDQLDDKAQTDLSNLVTATSDIIIDSNANLNLSGDKIYITSDNADPEGPEVWVQGRILASSDLTFTKAGASPIVISGFDVFDAAGQSASQSSEISIATGNITDATLTTEDIPSGDVSIKTGDVSEGAGISGDISLVTGQSVNGRGNITLDANQVLVTTSINMSANQIKDLADATDPTDAVTKQQLDAHINAASDAHDASAISVSPSGNLAATDVQAALVELQSDVDSRILSSEKGAANGVATLDAGGKVPVSQLPNSVMEYQGAWNASTNTPSLSDGTGNAGDVYRVSVAGTPTGFSDPSMSTAFAVGDFVIYSGSVWQKAPASDAVISVFGRQGVVTAQSGDYSASQITNTPAGNISATDVQAAINELDSEKFASADFDSSFDARLATKTTADLTEGTSLYFTEERAQDAVGTILADTDTINLTYTDGTPEIKADVKTQQSITSDASGIKLVGDAAAPGNSKYYGTDSSGTKGFHDLPTGGSANDIQEDSFAIANNQVSAANVTGLAFAANVRSFKALVSVEIDATLDLFETFELVGIKKGAGFEMAQSAVGDESGIVFTITSGGQVQYTSSNYAGFVSGTIRFRAITTSF